MEWILLVLGHPLLVPSLLYSLGVGIISFWLSLVLAVALVGGGRGWFGHLAGFLVASPVVLVGLGGIFLIDSHGILGRLVGGFDYDFPDSLGVGHIFVLLLKELPYMALVLVQQLKPSRELYEQGLVAGATRTQAFGHLVLPLLLQKSRAGLLISLVYGLNGADVNIIAGGTRPPSLSLVALKFFLSYDAQGFMTGLGFSVIILVVNAVVVGIHWWLLSRYRGQFYYPNWLSRILYYLAGLVVGMALASIFICGVWSISDGWFYPNLLPNGYTMHNWEMVGVSLWQGWLESMKLAFISSFMGFVMIIAVLIGSRFFHEYLWAMFLVPIILPEIVVAWVLYPWAGYVPYYFLLILSHIMLTIPYQAMIIGLAFHKLPKEWGAQAKIMGAGKIRVFFQIYAPNIYGALGLSIYLSLLVNLNIYAPSYLLNGGASLLYPDIIATINSANRAQSAVGGLFLAVSGYFMFLLVKLLIFCYRRVHRNIYF